MSFPLFPALSLHTQLRSLTHFCFNFVTLFFRSIAHLHNQFSISSSSSVFDRISNQFCFFLGENLWIRCSSPAAPHFHIHVSPKWQQLWSVGYLIGSINRAPAPVADPAPSPVFFASLPNSFPKNPKTKPKTKTKTFLARLNRGICSRIWRSRMISRNESEKLKLGGAGLMSHVAFGWKICLALEQQKNTKLPAHSGAKLL